MRQDDATGVSQGVQPGKRRSRRKVVEILQAILDKPDAMEEVAERFEVPRATVGHWLRRQRKSGLGRSAQVFFESPEGLAFLERVIVAVYIVFCFASLTGIRGVCKFLELTGLDRIVGAGFGTQHRIVQAIEEAIIAYGKEEQERLAKQMPRTDVTLCADETFHQGGICLVAIEPVSNYIVLEAYAEHRDAATWTAALRTSLDGLPVDVIQFACDQASGLLATAKDGFDAHQSPDLFHCQQEAGKGVTLALESQTASAEKHRENATERRVRIERAQKEYLASPGPGRPRDFESELAWARTAEEQAEGKVESCCSRRIRAEEAIKGIATVYHPFDLETGEKADGRVVHNRLRAQFDELDRIAEEAQLSERSREHLAKARRLSPLMVATIVWVLTTIRRWVDQLDLPPAVDRQVMEQLIPGLYLETAATKAASAEAKRKIDAVAQRLLQLARAPNRPLAKLALKDREAVERVARQAADLFQRSSSCVEGRNGRLSLYHHHLHSLRPGRQKALTVLQNYFSQRSDKTTAAERFFGAKPRDLFQFVLDRIPDLPRPHKRSTTQTLAQAA